MVACVQSNHEIFGIWDTYYTFLMGSLLCPSDEAKLNRFLFCCIIL